MFWLQKWRNILPEGNERNVILGAGWRQVYAGFYGSYQPHQPSHDVVASI